MKLLLNALIKFFCGVVLVGVFVFLPAGTLNFFNGWLFMGVMFFPILALGIVLYIKSPQLLRKRLNHKEKEVAQKGVVAGSAILFLVGFVLGGLDYRFSWSYVPMWLVITACVLFFCGYGMYAEVLRENAYLSRTIEVQENQKVIDSGLYGVVRHPMYLATILLFLSIPLILGSWWSFVVFLFYPVLIATRIENEEKVLSEQLEGYNHYKKKVKYKLIPYIW